MCKHFSRNGCTDMELLGWGHDFKILIDISKFPSNLYPHKVPTQHFIYLDFIMFTSLMSKIMSYCLRTFSFVYEPWVFLNWRNLLISLSDALLILLRSFINHFFHDIYTLYTANMLPGLMSAFCLFCFCLTEDLKVNIGQQVYIFLYEFWVLCLPYKGFFFFLYFLLMLLKNCFHLAL